MSLINNMLADLEQRRAASTRTVNLDNLSAYRRYKSGWGVGVIVLLVLLLMAVAGYFWLWPVLQKPSAPASAAKSGELADAVPIKTSVPVAALSAITLTGENPAELTLGFTATPDYQLDQNTNDVTITIHRQSALPVFSVRHPVTALRTRVEGDELQLQFQLAPDYRANAQMHTGAPATLRLTLVKKIPPVAKPIAKPAEKTPVQQSFAAAPAANALAAPRRQQVAAVATTGNHSSTAQSVKQATTRQSPAERDRRAYESALDQLDRGQTMTARQSLAAFIEQQPQSQLSSALYASLLLQAGDTTLLGPLLAQARQYYPDDLDLLMLDARLLLQLGAPEKAERLMASKSPVLAQHPDYYELLASVAQRSGNYLLSARLYGSLLRIDETVGDWWVGLAISQELLGEPLQAQGSYNQALTLNRLSVALRQHAEKRLSVLKTQQVAP